MKTRLLPMFVLFLLLAGCSSSAAQTLQPGTATAQMQKLHATWAAITTATAAAPTQTPGPAPTTAPEQTSIPLVSNPSTDYLVFNLAQPPFDQLCARQAFALAIDRQALAKSMYDPAITPATTLVPPGVWPDGKSRYGKYGLNFDPVRARQVLSTCPALTGPGAAPVEFMVTDDNTEVAAVLQAQWKTNLGLDVKVNPVTVDNLLSITLTDPPPVYYIGWYADYLSPYNFLHDALKERVKWTNSEYTQLVEDANHETDPAKQTQEYEAAERILVESEVVIVPLIHY